MQTTNNKIVKQFLIIILFLFIDTSFSQQSNQVVNTTPNGLMDNIFDQYGRRFSLSDIKIEANKHLPNNTTSITDTTPLCVAGYFNLYFENGSGMEIVSDPTQNTINTNRRSVICQVFQDLSQFIVSDNLNFSGNKVNIWVRNINNVIIAPNSTNGVLGYGTSYYNVPYKNSASFGGIADGEVWKTIHTGQDSYSGLFSPLVSNGSTTPTSYYHGVVAINFNTNNTPAINWFSTPLTSNATNLNYDLYTEVLRQATHLLGFTSLIDVNGQSKFGTGFNYYSRYDLFLKNNANTQPLIKNNVGECSMLYNYNFNTILSTTILNPNPSSSSNTTVCSNALKYGINSVPVYTPNSFDRYSLSHFEDVCTTPPNVNDAYFVVCNAPSNNGTGTNPINTKRFLKPEERNVLIDLGYSVKNEYGTTSQKSYYFYGGVSPTVAHPSAKNLGIQANGEYYLYGSNTISITVGLLLGYQLGATGFECLQDIYDPTATINGVNNLTNLNATNPNQALTFQSNVQGLHLLRFVPVRTQGNSIVRGNIAYVYVYVNSIPPNACDIINNGNFEASTTCGFATNGNPSWSLLAYTPDFFRRNCTNNNNNFNVGTNTFASNPASDSYSGSSNDNFAGLYTTTIGTEALQTNLSSPLIAGNQYVLSFWAKVNNGFTAPATNNLAVYFSSYPNQLAYSGNLISGSFQSFVSNSIQIGPPTNVPNDNNWHYYSISFTQPLGTPNHNSIAVYLQNENGYMFIDDVFILPQEQFDTFDLPDTICVGGSIPNLASYFNPNTPTNGNLTFLGNNVTLNSGLYSFTPSTSNLGLNVISYSYSYQGCVRSFYDTINVISGSLTPTFAPIPVLCQGSTPPVLPTTSTNGIIGTWNPTTISTTASGNYTFTPTAGQCAVPVSSAIQVLLNTAFVANADTFTVTFTGGTTPLTTASVLLNDTYNGGAIPTTIPGIPYTIVPTGTPPTGGISFNAATGVYTILSNTTPGTYTYYYYLNNNCYNTAIKTVKIIVNKIVGSGNTRFGFCYSVAALSSTSSTYGQTTLYAGSTVNGQPASAANCTITVVNPNTGATTPLPPQVTAINSNGTFTLAAGLLPSSIVFYYKLCANGTCSATITCVIDIFRTFEAFPDNITTVAGANGTVTYNVLSNDKSYIGNCGSNGIVPATTSNVTITNVVNDPPYYKIVPSTGAIQPYNNPPTIPTLGTHILSYTLCDNDNLNICQNVSVVITVPLLKMNGNDTTTTETFDINKTIVAPNPSNGNFTIYFNTYVDEANIEVYTLIGQKVYEVDLNNTTEALLGMNELASGTYLLKINRNEQVLTKRIIIE